MVVNMSIWICRGCVMGVSSVSENHSKALWKSNMWGHTYIDKTSCTSQSRFPSVLAPGEVPVVMPCVMQDQAKKDKNNKNKGSQTPRCCQSIICCLDWIPGHQQPGVVLLSHQQNQLLLRREVIFRSLRRLWSSWPSSGVLRRLWSS